MRRVRVPGRSLRWCRPLRTAAGRDPETVPTARLEDYRYQLPSELIATAPALPRGSSRLLVGLPEVGSLRTPLVQGVRARVRELRGLSASLRDAVDMDFRDLPAVLPPNAHLVFNESRVFAARLYAADGVEVLCLAPERPSSDPAMVLPLPFEGQTWRCLLRTTRLRTGDAVTVQQGPLAFRLRLDAVHSPWIEEDEVDGVEASMTFEAIPGDGRDDSSRTAEDIFAACGRVPLPPYMAQHREPHAQDAAYYQTVYANEATPGSVAAPTAGLHFTEEVLQSLTDRGIRRDAVALHVSAGTFRPVTAAEIRDHDMHRELFSVPGSALRSLRESLGERRPVVPVGTTSSRCLESLYWLGVKELLGLRPEHQALTLDQWEAYELDAALRVADRIVSPAEALEALTPRLGEQGSPGRLVGSTALCIVAPYTFRLCDALVTNFHQADSTLMLLVGALVGGPARLRRLYEHAVAEKYRFLSYGDACLLLNAQENLSEADGPDDARDADKVQALREAVARAHTDAGKSMKVLLHSCCAPCSGAMIEEMHTQGIDVTIFFYNPNIHPLKEYLIRKDENKRYADKLGIPFVDADYGSDVDEWYDRARGMEFEPERGARCSMCFDMRMEKTAAHAATHGFTHFTTTNATSRWKDQGQVNASGRHAAAPYRDSATPLEYVEYDWQTDRMTERKYRINAAERFYKQEYCGCTYSLRDVNAYRKKDGFGPVRIGQAGVYSDPVADALEESPAVVNKFFGDEQLRVQQEVYRERKKRRDGGTDANNW